MDARNLPFRLETAIVHRLNELTGRRPSSEPYISGDGFRALCRHRFDVAKGGPFDPAAVTESELVFCDARRLKEFLAGPARRISAPFRVISHNADATVDDSVVALFPDRLQRLYAQNCVIDAPRVVPIPIGLENRHYHCNGIPADFDRLRRRPVVKRPRILSAFTVGTNRVVREEALRQLRRNPLNDVPARTNSRAYRRAASAYMLIASPPGNGVDCHRTWEAMYLGCVPIVLDTPPMRRFAHLGLPLCLVDSYESVASWDEAKITDVYAGMRTKFESPSLWLGFWKKVIAEGRLP